MERTRLQHLADFLCHTFTDPSLAHDYQMIAEARSGTLWIDLLYGHTFLNGKPCEDLIATSRLIGVLHMELGGDAREILEEANLKVHFETEQHPEQRDKSARWADPTGRFITCLVQCRSRVGAAGETATGLYSEELEWPYPFDSGFRGRRMQRDAPKPRNE